MKKNDAILVTGAAGFLGHYILAELLRRGMRCIALVRPPRAASEARLMALLREAGGGAETHCRDGLLEVLEGTLPADLSALNDVRASQVVHCAGSVVFECSARGEPFRTNVEGTEALCAWAQRAGCRGIHLISTAYVVGTAAYLSEAAVSADAWALHNDYERSKIAAEAVVLGWAAEAGRQATVFRPSIVVGDSIQGRATRYLGFYQLVRATELLARSLEGRPDHERHAVRLRLRADASGLLNLVPVDYVAAMVGTVVAEQRWQGRVYHLTHPQPPSNGQIKAWLERFFNIGGGCFIPPEAAAEEPTEQQELFEGQCRYVLDYLAAAPRFGRENTRQAEASCGKRCPPWDWPSFQRMVRYAVETNWGRQSGCESDPALQASHRSAAEAACGADTRACACYFECFLPAFVPRSRVARMTGLTTSARFIIGARPADQWTCRFERGQLSEVTRGPNGIAEFSYRTTVRVFLEAIAGLRTPQDLFFAGDAEILGDVEKGLKMAMILHEFTKEFPCDAARLGA